MTERIRIEEGSEVDLYRRRLLLLFNETYESRVMEALQKHGVSTDTHAAFAGTLKDVLMDLGLMWYNPMDAYMFVEDIEDFDPEFVSGDGTRVGPHPADRDKEGRDAATR